MVVEAKVAAVVVVVVERGRQPPRYGSVSL
jgi:hypothetical protein